MKILPNARMAPGLAKPGSGLKAQPLQLDMNQIKTTP